VSVLATIEEFVMHLLAKDYDTKYKTIFQMGK